jgi:hypothetical protein
MNKEEFITMAREPTLIEDVVTYIGLVASVVFLAVAFICLSLISGQQQTNSNSIHRNFVVCLLLAQLLFLLALKLRGTVQHHEVSDGFFYSDQQKIISHSLFFLAKKPHT